jgi:hypothetical protein
MPDFLQYAITPLGNASVTVPRATIAALIVDSMDQSITIADFTGANALNFPVVLTTLSAADRAELIQMLAGWLLLKKAGL